MDDTIDLQTFTTTALEAINLHTREITGQSADGRVISRLSGDFELIEIAGLDLDAEQHRKILESVNDAIAKLQAAMFEGIEAAFGGQEGLQAAMFGQEEQR